MIVDSQWPRSSLRSRPDNRSQEYIQAGTGMDTTSMHRTATGIRTGPPPTTPVKTGPRNPPKYTVPNKTKILKPIEKERHNRILKVVHRRPMKEGKERTGSQNDLEAMSVLLQRSKGKGISQ